MCPYSVSRFVRVGRKRNRLDRMVGVKQDVVEWLPVFFGASLDQWQSRPFFSCGYMDTTVGNTPLSPTCMYFVDAWIS